MTRVARRGSARREQQAKRAAAELRSAARSYARALDAMLASPLRAETFAPAYWRAEARLTTAALRFARTEP